MMITDTNPWIAGYEAAREILNELPGPQVGLFARKLLAVNDDPADDPQYCAGYRQAMHEATRPTPMLSTPREDPTMPETTTTTLASLCGIADSNKRNAAILLSAAEELGYPPNVTADGESVEAVWSSVAVTDGLEILVESFYPLAGGRIDSVVRMSGAVDGKILSLREASDHAEAFANAHKRLEQVTKAIKAATK